MSTKGKFISFFLVLVSCMAQGQMETIAYEGHGNTERLRSNNPFKDFVGEWRLKNDVWIQNWGAGTDTIPIPGHHTICRTLNTPNTLLSVIDGPEPNGHIFWSYNPVTKEVDHLSSFGELRAGVGTGSISKIGNLTLKIKFEGEPEDTYRMYNYKWRNHDEYHMKSVQYGMDGSPTGLFYEGTFVRLPKEDLDLKHQIEAVLSVLDDAAISVEEQLKVYATDVVHMAPGNEINLGKDALRNYLEEQRKYGSVEMKHRIMEIEPIADIVLMRGTVKGTFHPRDGAPPIAFQTKNLFVFGTTEGELKIKKVIYNASPLGQGN